MNRFVTSFDKLTRLAGGAALLSALLLSWSGLAFAGSHNGAKKTKSNKTTKSIKQPVAQKKPTALAARTSSKKEKGVHPSARKVAGKKSRVAAARPIARSKNAQRHASLASKAVALKSSTRIQSLAPTLSTTQRVSYGERLGLRASVDQLDLSSSVALVMDQETNEILFSKNDSAVLPIASLTKLMTGLVIADANLPMGELITITGSDVDTLKGSRSRLAVGTTLTRGELMHLSLMSSENRAAHALGRTYPGGLKEFVRQMNAKARSLGMLDTRYVEPTGLMSQNQSSARDLATLVSTAYQRPILRSLSTSPGHQVELGHRVLQFNNSNRLVHSPLWDIGLQKTGYISEAGRCLVMQARVAGRQLIMVFLDSAGKFTRLDDAERVRRWVEAQDVPLVTPRPQG
jgi:D-alanyl-D-alanine endopeptidase (penicillin-binding protein 7)